MALTGLILEKKGCKMCDSYGNAKDASLLAYDTMYIHKELLTCRKAFCLHPDYSSTALKIETESSS
jgi:hypothetical protein